MIPVYLFAAILGTGLLVFGFFGGEGDAGEAAHFDPVTDLGGEGPSWTRALSVRSLSYALAGFGLTGLGLATVGTGTATGLALSLLMGFVAGSSAAVLFRWLATAQGGFGEPSRVYVGGIGRTEVRIPAGGRGRIHLLHRGRTLSLAATSMGGEIERQEPVIVVDMVDGVAIVDHAPAELMP
jgi:hypothetical protein